MTREIEIQPGMMVEFKASAALPRIYREMYGRDLFKDIRELQDPIQAGRGAAVADAVYESLPMFEELAYAMAKHAKPEMSETITEWLENFEMGAIIGIIPDLMDLWSINQKTTAESKKNYVPALVK